MTATLIEPAGEFERAERAAQFVLSQTPLRPRVALVLGSGVGGLADDLTEAVRIPYATIPCYPQPTAEGHAGQLVIGKLGGVAVAAMQGRVHTYEGLPLKDVVFPIRVFGRMGIRAIILTNAAGGISPRLKRGCLVVLEDHINLQGTNPLAGANDERLGTRFVDMTDAYYAPYREMTIAAGRNLGLEITTGVYAAMSGPSYETPAEIRFLRTIGADVVGMSTVSEVITARHQAMRVLGISCVTNMAAGIQKAPITHEEVLETGRRVQDGFRALLAAVVPAIAADVEAGEEETSQRRSSPS
jgi:purine-nucleoside phosphorylase